MYQFITSKKKAIQVIKKNPLKGILEDKVINHNATGVTSYVKRRYSYKKRCV